MRISDWSSDVCSSDLTFWRDTIGVSSRGRMAGSGQGYQHLRLSSRIRKHGDGQPGADASYLHGLPDITVESLNEVLIDTRELQPFRHRSEDRRGGKEWVSTCRSRGGPYR